MKKFLKIVGWLAFCGVSSGWVLPAWLACSTVLAFHREQHGWARASSFPYFEFAQQMISLAALWLWASLVLWGCLCLLAVRKLKPRPQ